MVKRRFHYEQAFEHYLRANRVPYISVDEARKALLARGGDGSGRTASAAPASTNEPRSLKSFDFVVNAASGNLLIDVKGRKCRTRVGRTRVGVGGRAGAEPRLFDDKQRTSGGSGGGGLRAGRLDSWVTLDDVEGLSVWQRLFGTGFRAMFVFVYWCESQPPDALFQEVFEYSDRWYAMRAVNLDDYRSSMKERSRRWRTVHVPAERFEAISRPLTLHELTA